MITIIIGLRIIKSQKRIAMKRIFITCLFYVVGFYSFSQVSMNKYENTIFKQQLIAFTQQQKIYRYSQDWYFGNVNNVGGTFIFQFNAGSPSEKLEGLYSYGGWNLCVQQFSWHKKDLQNNMGYVNRIYYGSSYKNNFFKAGLGGYIRWTMHKAFEYLQYPISDPYVDEKPNSLRLNLIYNFNLNFPHFDFDLQARIREYLLSMAKFNYHIGENLKLYHGLEYQYNEYNNLIGSKKIYRLALINEVKSNKFFLTTNIASYYDSNKYLFKDLYNMIQTPFDKLSYETEISIKPFLFGVFYEKAYGFGYEGGFHFGDDELNIYFLLKYNDGMREPLLRETKNIWSLTLRIFLNENDEDSND